MKQLSMGDPTNKGGGVSGKPNTNMFSWKSQIARWCQVAGSPSLHNKEYTKYSNIVDHNICKEPMLILLPTMKWAILNSNPC